MNVIYSALIILTFLPMSAHARSTEKFSCGQIRGTFECGSTKNLSIIEFRGNQLTVIDDSDIPLSYTLGNSSPGETASEKQHVKYTSSCNGSEVKVVKQVLHKNGSGMGKETITYSVGGDSQLHTKTVVKGPVSSGENSAICTRVASI
jgi:hypothetical protein